MRKLIIFMLLSAATVYAQNAYSGVVDRGSLRVISDIAGTIFIDGEDTGVVIKAKGSALFGSVLSGKTEVSVIAASGETIKATVLVEANRTVEVAVTTYKAPPQDVTVILVDPYKPANIVAVPEPIFDTVKGCYYVQVMALNRYELVNNELRRLEVNVAPPSTPIVQKALVKGLTYYRIMYGPYTLSQSRSLVQQFRAKGYIDAFIWLAQ